MDLELKGKSALITGGSKGIGLATARAFAAEGVSLNLAARSTGDLESARNDIESDFGVPVSIHTVDLSQGDTARKLAKKCSDVGILVNNAGAIPGGTLEDVDEDVWRQAWDLKLFGYINMMRAIVFLGSPRARYISGTVLTIDGGLSASQAVIGS